MTAKEINSANIVLESVHQKLNFSFVPINSSNVFNGSLESNADGNNISYYFTSALSKQLTEEECKALYNRFDEELEDYFDFPETVISENPDGTYEFSVSMYYNPEKIKKVILL